METTRKTLRGFEFQQKYEMTSYNYPKNDHPKNVGKLSIARLKKWIRVNNEEVIIRLFIMT
jgi:hypothetical protein